MIMVVITYLRIVLRARYTRKHPTEWVIRHSASLCYHLTMGTEPMLEAYLNLVSHVHLTASVVQW
jgi:hypothetical protein